MWNRGYSDISGLLHRRSGTNVLIHVMNVTSEELIGASHRIRENEEGEERDVTNQTRRAGDETS